jgi:hypothetical protein
MYLTIHLYFVAVPSTDHADHGVCGGQLNLPSYSSLQQDFDQAINSPIDVSSTLYPDLTNDDPPAYSILQKHPLDENTSSSSSQNSTSLHPASIYIPSEEDKDETATDLVNKTFQILGVSPLKRKNTRSMSYIKQKALESQEKMVEKIIEASTVNVSTRHLMSQNCVQCDD